MTLYVDTGWVLNIQVNVSPQNTPIRDWGALHSMVERHRYERVAGEPYYEEVVSRAATFLHTALRLRPFSDYNASIGIACAWEYMEQSGVPFELPYGEVAKLVSDIRSDEAGMTETARCLRDWAE
jgi:prophage maintenance system killer protein